MAFARWAPVILLAVGLVGCSAGGGSPPPQAPVATAAPTLGPTPTSGRLFRRPRVRRRPQNATMEAEAAPSEDEIAFLDNLDELIADATDLWVTPCEDLQAITQQNPNLVPSIRGYAAAIKRVSTTQPMLDTEAVKASISDLDHTMGQPKVRSACAVSSNVRGVYVGFATDRHAHPGAPTQPVRPGIRADGRW